MRKVLIAVLSLLLPAAVFAAWEPVGEVNLATLSPADFADNELEIPYYLAHFQRVANAVTEAGPNRGFLDLKVNREPKDNEPYNARIQENHSSLAFFYCTNRKWNPYYGKAAVKVRLEAMLEFWVSIQGPDGLFSEYRPKEYSLAPTGFGVRATAETLGYLSAGGPTIDEALKQRVMAAQRKAIMALLTGDKVFAWGREYSNQFSGVYFAALSYLKMKPDAEMRQALLTAARRASQTMQSPGGFMYEQGGPDFGYSHVHETNLRTAWPYLRNDQELRAILLPADERYCLWLSRNLLLAADRSGYFTNAGIDTRTSHNFETFSFLPLAQQQRLALPFCMTDVEHRQELAQQRAQLQAEWPKVKPLTVPSAYAYRPGFGFKVWFEQSPWYPTAAERDAAISKLPYIARSEFNHQIADPRPYVYTYVRKPSYYAGFNSGKIRIARQDYGLGFLWNPDLSCVMQSVAGTPWFWGTRVGNDTQVAEAKDLSATITVAGQRIEPQPGTRDLPAGAVLISYPLPGGGTKEIRFDQEMITVTITASGPIAEMLPLVHGRQSGVALTGGKVTLSGPGGGTGAGARCTIESDSSVKAAVVREEPMDPSFTRTMVQLTGQNRLVYRIQFTR